MNNIKATSTIYLTHNSNCCLLVSAAISVQNAVGIELIPVVFINDGTGSPVKASNSWTSYAMKGSGDVYVAGSAIKPGKQQIVVKLLLYQCFCQIMLCNYVKRRMNCVVIFVFIVQKQRVMYQDQFMLILKQRLKKVW